jgi:hypothetical protein
VRRRELLLAGGAVLLAPATAAAAADDPGAVQALRRAELDAVLAYGAAGGFGRLARAAEAHAGALRTVLGALVAPVPPGPRRLEDVRAPVATHARALAAAPTRRARLLAAAGLEAALRDACAQRLPALAAPDVARAVGEVYAGHAAQAARLKMSAGRDPI